LNGRRRPGERRRPELKTKTENKNRMKKNFLSGLIVLVAEALMGLYLLALLGLAPAAIGQEAQQSFGATNVLASGIVLTTWPTNGSGTNTGSGISTAFYPRAGFYFSGNVLTAGTATVQVVRSPLSSSPTTNYHYETVSVKSFTIPMPTTGWLMWVTNIEEEFVRPGNWIGISLATNAVGVVSNLDIGLTKKLIPIGTR
jgi:hypothetical protein